MFHQSHNPWLNHCNKVKWKVSVRNFIVYFSPALCYFMFLYSKLSSRRLAFSTFKMLPKPVTRGWWYVCAVTKGCSTSRHIVYAAFFKERIPPP
jgi:formylglycine-generating enzyme required for sulfatase activity